MTTNPKISKVLEYLIKEDKSAAKDLLHQIFIEKARAIHEEIMSMDEMMDDDDMEENVGGTGDEGLDLTNEIDAMENEIDFEETVSEDDDEEMGGDMDGMGGDMDSMSGDMGGDMDSMGGEEHTGEFSGIEDKMHDLEAALEELKAEFEKLEAEEAGEDHEDGDEEGEEGEGEEEEGEMEESWDLDEDFDDLAESLDLEVVERDMEKSAKTPEEVGAGRSGMAIDKSAKSPLPSSQKDRMGAKPVETGKGPTHNGYNRETAPKTDQLAGMKPDNRRKKSTDGMGKMSKEGNSSAALNRTQSEFGIGQTGKMSPLSRGGSNLK